MVALAVTAQGPKMTIHCRRVDPISPTLRLIAAAVLPLSTAETAHSSCCLLCSQA